MAPFWSDNDIRVSGDVCYEVHDKGSDYLSQVNAFISNKTQTEFNGKWMLLVEWDKVHPYPHGSGSSSWWWYWYSQDLKEFTNSVSLISNNFFLILGDMQYVNREMIACLTTNLDGSDET